MMLVLGVSTLRPLVMPVSRRCVGWWWRWWEQVVPWAAVPVGTALPMTARASVLLVMPTAWVMWWE